MHYQSYNHAYLLLGSNMGERKGFLNIAQEYIEEKCGEIVTSSAYYETAPWGNEDQPGFLNQVIIIKTNLTPSTLLDAILDIERKIGRVRKEKYDPRNIDIDILFIDNLVINIPQLIVPHPEIANRRFVLVPLAEIAPDLVHPILKQTISQLLVNCKDPLAVNELKG